MASFLSTQLKITGEEGGSIEKMSLYVQAVSKPVGHLFN